MSILVFDLDGTLITCANRQTSLAVACSASHGFQLDARAFWCAKRHGATSHTAIRAQGCPDDLAVSISQNWQTAVETPYWLQLDRQFDDVRESLLRLDRIGIRRVILTARARPYWLRLQLERLQLLTMIDELITVPPMQAAAAKAKVLVRLRPVGFIGDTESDAAAAKKADTLFIGLDRGQRSREYLLKSGVNSVVENLPTAFTAMGL